MPAKPSGSDLPPPARPLGRLNGSTESNAGPTRAHHPCPADADGSYRISGTKIFMTGGEQDLTENIIHLVLAKLPDAPAGPKGISPFLVPKVLVWRGRQPRGGQRGVLLLHRAQDGHHGPATCVMHLDGACGYLVVS
ncbi:Acyl-CoA dehydrogenase OS=Stutzerimonas stutzeri OX=316 GN=CXK95_14925 PE=3 SV=1 [Stutzerimonas stutzeri]